MENDLIINGKDAYKTWKVCMGSKFLDNLETPPPLKDYITSGSRTENGQRVIVSPRNTRNALQPRVRKCR